AFISVLLLRDSTHTGFEVAASAGSTSISSLEGGISVTFQVIEAVPDRALDNGVGTEGGNLEFGKVQGVVREGLADGRQQRFADPGEWTAEDHQVGIEQGPDRGQAHREASGHLGERRESGWAPFRDVLQDEVERAVPGPAD